MSKPSPEIRPPSSANNTADKPCPSRISSNRGRSTPVLGKVVWAPARSLWFLLMYVGALLGGYATFRLDALALCLVASAITLCGYSVGIHRRLVHKSFQCHRWVETVLVYIGVLAGLGGPFSLVERHDIREWAQSSPRCHPYFTGRQNPIKDWLWATHCELQLHYPPLICCETDLTQSKFYQWLEQTWMFQQLPLAIAFYYCGGWSWVFWGIHVRISLCATLLWLSDYLACHLGQRSRHAQGAAIQLGNISALGLLSMGESWQNNHQNASHLARFGGANFGRRSQIDLGWQLIKLLESAGLAWDISSSHPWETRTATRPNSRHSIGSRSTADTVTPINNDLPQLSHVAKYRRY